MTSGYRCCRGSGGGGVQVFAFAVATRLSRQRECPSQKAERRCWCGGGAAGRRASRDGPWQGVRCKETGPPKRFRPIVRPSLRSGSLAPALFRGPAATGHPWPIAALPASMPVDPLHRTSARPPDGAGRSKSKARSKTSPRRLTGLFWCGNCEHMFFGGASPLSRLLVI